MPQIPIPLESAFLVDVGLGCKGIISVNLVVKVVYCLGKLPDFPDESLNIKDDDLNKIYDRVIAVADNIVASDVDVFIEARGINGQAEKGNASGRRRLCQRRGSALVSEVTFELACWGSQKVDGRRSSLGINTPTIDILPLFVLFSTSHFLIDSRAVLVVVYHHLVHLCVVLVYLRVSDDVNFWVFLFCLFSHSVIVVDPSSLYS
ncbi:hypothetical protein VNO78_23101 [Psophocarpus tetragonolobus]|uniref:Uncharacterized protein n=1 Tax=Psophocarpus tetragonolobus TaxID=3891 RepID=A0AAN9XDE1_PSOTE